MKEQIKQMIESGADLDKIKEQIEDFIIETLSEYNCEPSFEIEEPNFYVHVSGRKYVDKAEVTIWPVADGREGINIDVDLEKINDWLDEVYRDRRVIEETEDMLRKIY